MPPLERDPDDRDDPQSIDMEWDDDDTATEECPACGREVYADVPRCPGCGAWLDESFAERQSRRWLWPVIVAVLVAVILVFWHGLR